MKQILYSGLSFLYEFFFAEKPSKTMNFITARYSIVSIVKNPIRRIKIAWDNEWIDRSEQIQYA